MIAPMRRIFWGLGVITVLAFGLARCWHGSRQGPNQPQQTPSAAAESVAPLAEASRVSPASAARRDSSSSPVDAGQESLLQRLHALEGTNPGLAASMALEDRQRSPNSPNAEERDVVLVAALYNQRDILGAKREAWYYFMHYPNGRFTEYLSKLTRIQPPTTRPRE